MKNNKYIKISAGLGVFALAIGFGLTLGLSPAKVQAANFTPNENYSATANNGSNPSNFYQEMSDLMKKNNIDCPMLGNDGDANVQDINSGNFNGANMMNFGSNIPNQQP